MSASHVRLHGFQRRCLLLSLVLIACVPRPGPTSTGGPDTGANVVRFTEVSIAPEPIVGKVVTLRIVVLTPQSEPNVTIRAHLPAEVKLVAGADTWTGATVANRPQVLEMSICVQAPGQWRLLPGAVALMPDSTRTRGGTTEIYYIESSTTSGRLISGAGYLPTPSGPVVVTAVPALAGTPNSGVAATPSAAPGANSRCGKP